MTSDEAKEIKELLTEIRDLQKAHFERYCAFTEEILAADKNARESAAEAAIDQEALFQEERNYREEMRHAVLSSQRQALIGLAVVIGVLVLMIVAYVFVGGVIEPVGVENFPGASQAPQ